MRTELGSWRRAWRRVGKAEVEVEVGADMVEKKQAEEKEEEEEEEETKIAIQEKTTMIKSNNPHLAGGEQLIFMNVP